MVEYHVSSILFNMDSAVECMVYMLNALGYIADSNQFLDLTNHQELRQISPTNILGKPQDYEKGVVEGYKNFFPSLKNYWDENRDLIYKIFEQHDVSKHRKAVFEGGKHRTDPPPGFFELWGYNDEQQRPIWLAPMEEILLTPEPKIPWRQRKQVDYEKIPTLEDICEKFCTFVNMCGIKALEDAHSKIKLNDYTLRR